MRERRRATIHELRLAIECLPRSTRVAMLDGIESNEIIVGAYSENGGICPMLAAHRAGGRTNFISFAKAWDRFAFRESRGRFGLRAARRYEARRATARELLVLRTHLEASLLEDERPADRPRRRDEGTPGPDRRPRGSNRPPGSDHLQGSDRSPGSHRREARIAREQSTGVTAKVRPGDRYRHRELRSCLGWAWTRVVRTHDDYEYMLDRLE